MIAGRADQAIAEPGHAPPLLAAIVRGGIDGRSPSDWVDAHAGIQWHVWAVMRVVQLLEKLCMVWGVKKP